MYPRTLLLFLLCISALPLSALAQGKAAYVDPATKMEFVAIPGGTFLMGDAADEWAQPVHEVKVKPFLFGRYEVTFDQYAVYCAANKQPLPNDNGFGTGKHPVINVSWREAVAFTEWLSAQSGRTYRLPSEAEWEYAARGGKKTPYPWGEAVGKNLANCDGCGSKWDNRSTAPVGSFKPNPFGLYDVVGNVYEWCLDRYNVTYAGAPADGSPWLESSREPEERINRGASYMQPLTELAVSKRCSAEPDNRSNEYGFRVLLEP